MFTLIMTMRIGLAVLFFSFLLWFPGEMSNGSGWQGPTPAMAGESGGADPNPENFSVGTYAGNSFVGRVSILNNSLTDSNGFYRVQIINSFRGFTGIAQVNQAAGALNNQTNYIGVAGSPGGTQATGLSLNYGSRVKNNTLTTSNNTYQADIKGSSFAAGSGVTLVNQTAGHMNTQMNAFNMAVGNQAAENLTDLQMGAISSNNHLTANPQAANNRAITLELDKGAFKDYTGIWSTSQIAGNMDQVTTIFNVRVTPVP
jgi:hypothetical protein